MACREIKLHENLTYGLHAAHSFALNYSVKDTQNDADNIYNNNIILKNRNSQTLVWACSHSHSVCYKTDILHTNFVYLFFSNSTDTSIGTRKMSDHI